jgi:hypothetical protein
METTTLENEIVIKEKISRIKQLNLEPIMVKLMDKDEGKGWTMEQVLVAEKLYKRFLILNLKYPNESIVPTVIIDTFWHYHILDTEKYAIDCQDTFGYFLHHFPYFGMRGKEDAQNLKNAFDSTKNLFITEFKESLIDASAIFQSINTDSSSKCDGSGTGSNQCAKCTDGSSCGGGKCESGPRKPSTQVDYSIRPSLI